MAPLSKEQLTALTRLGAHARLAELVNEMDAILAAFPDLGSMPARPGPGGGDGPGPVAKTAAPRKRYHMSAAKRKAAAERMRKYWAARREAKEMQATAPPAVAEEKPIRKARKAAKPSGGKGR